MDKIKLNGKYTKEQLTNEFKKFDVEHYSLIKEHTQDIWLYKDDDMIGKIAAHQIENEIYNLGSISRNMAIAMNDLMDISDVLNKKKDGYEVYYNSEKRKWYVGCYPKLPTHKTFKSKIMAEIACDLLNECYYEIFGLVLVDEND